MKYRWLWLFLLVPVALGLARLRFDAEVFDLLPDELPAVAGLKLYQQHFANARELVLTIQAPDAELAENTARAIAEHLRPQTNLVTSATWQVPFMEHPEQAGELLAYLWFNQPPAIFRELTNQLAPEKLAATLALAREQLSSSLTPGDIARLSYDPFGLTRLPESVASAAPSFGQGQDMFSSEDGKFRLVFLQASRDLRSYRQCDEWLKQIKPVIQAAIASIGEGASNVSVGYTGRPAFVAEVAMGMEHDMTISVGGTAVIIAVLFWLAHRRFKPMLWLLTLLALILGATLALGGLIYGTINVVSMGFAAILLGLAVDYAVVHYQEALAHPDLLIPQIRRAIAPSIFWAAVTTISAFLVLNFGGLPGLGQLGTLVGLGVALSACIMIFEFLPPLFPERRVRKAKLSQSPVSISPATASSTSFPPQKERKPFSDPPLPSESLSSSRSRPIFILTAAVVLFTLSVLLLGGRPAIDPTANALRPRNSPAYDALAQIQAHLNKEREPLWVIIRGRTESDAALRLDEVQSVLERAASNHLIAGFTLPTPLWPRPEFQEANRAAAQALAAQRGGLREAARTNGFAEAALGLTERILDAWQVAGATRGVFWPTNPMSQWIFEKFAARTPTNLFALGLVKPAGTRASAGTADLAALESQLPARDVWLSGWELLGSSIFSRVKANMWKVLAPMLFLVFLSLWLAFRRPREISLSIAVLLLSGLVLLSIMRLAGWSWNLLNLMAIPLILGTGVDYSIFMQLALRRYHGDLRMAYRSVGRALLLCGGTAIAGFGSLAWSSNVGMASLGQVCAVGIGSNMLIAIFLLPIWWDRAGGGTSLTGRGASRPPPGGVRPSLGAGALEKGEVSATPRIGPSVPATPEVGPAQAAASGGPPDIPPTRDSTPSSLYGPRFWRLGLWGAKVLPPKIFIHLSCSLASLYWLLALRRRKIIIENLLPALNGDAVAAKAKSRELLRQFAIKLVDLWRYEAGLPIDDLLGETTSWNDFLRAKEKKRGVLLLTPHLGNWELGGPWLTSKGMTLQVITLAEPGEGFTQLRQASRARWNIETIVVRNDPFAFVEVIRRLENGATVALLVDRPPPPTAVTVELFGRPFSASIAAAELARASGCVLLPVYLPRNATGYGAHVLPEIPYDRAALRDRAARQRLTQQILSAFEPAIRQHLDQWFHFVPIWTWEGPGR